MIHSWLWPRLCVMILLGLSLAAGLTLAGQARAQSTKSLRVGIVGDQYGSSGDPDPAVVLANGLAVLKQKQVRAILHVGDLIEGIGQPPAEYGSRFSRMAGILDQAQIPWFLTPGDHDVNPKEFTANSSDRSIEKLFFLNYSPRRPELHPGLYYSFDVAGYHFIALNSLEHLRTDIRWGDAFLAKVSDEQFAWLQQDLARHRSARGIVVFTHQPLWYNVAAWQPVHQLLRHYPVRAVVAGHMHYSQDEGQLDGIRYLVAGATGGNVKHGSPEVGNAQVVSVMTLNERKVDIELLSVGSDAPHSFASRMDMDRIQALDSALDTLSAWQYEPANAMCLQNGLLVMQSDKSPAAVRLRAIGNPIDIPVRLGIRVEAKGLPPAPGKFADGVCQSLAVEGCTIIPAAKVTISNISTVEFRWPNSTESPNTQQVPPLPALWEAILPTTGVSVAPGSTLHVRLKYSFPVDSGAKYVEQDASTIVMSCGKP